MSTLIIPEYLDRSIAGIVMSLNNAILPFLGIVTAVYFYYINQWRYIFIVTTLCAILILYLVKIYFLESAPWLNSKNKIMETIAVLKEIARINGKEQDFQKFLDVNAGNLILILIRFNK
jgi:MFS family permease